MNGLTWIHIAGGMVALLCGTLAVAARKGGGIHIAAGTWFCMAMLVLGTTASILAPFKSPPDSPIGGIMVCYFVATGSFFLGQQDVLPQALRGKPILVVLALTPIALMLFWLVRVRFSRMNSGLKRLDAATGIPAEARHLTDS